MRYENDAFGLKAIGLSGARGCELHKLWGKELWGKVISSGVSRRGRVQVIENDEKATNDIFFFSILAL